MQNTRLDRRSSSRWDWPPVRGTRCLAGHIRGHSEPDCGSPSCCHRSASSNRLQTFTYTRIGANGGAITDPDGTIVNFPAEGIIAGFQAQIKSTPRTEFVEGQAGNEMYEAAQNLPDNLVAKSPVYHIDVRGRAPAQAIVTIPIPNDSLPYETLSVYEWTGDDWRHVPATVFAAEDQIEARLDYVPQAFHGGADHAGRACGHAWTWA